MGVVMLAGPGVSQMIVWEPESVFRHCTELPTAIVVGGNLKPAMTISVAPPWPLWPPPVGYVDLGRQRPRGEGGRASLH